MSETIELKIAIREWLDRMFHEQNITANEFSKKSGVSQSTMSRLLNEDVDQPRRATLRAIIRASKTPPPAIVTSYVDEMSATPNIPIVPLPPRPPDDLIEIWGVILVGTMGEFRLNPHAISYLRRPPTLASQRRLASFYAPDESMAPRWHSGEPVMVDLNRPAPPMSYALITMNPADGKNNSETHLFRRYIGRSGGVISLSRLDGEPQPSIPIERILSIRHILTWNDLLT